MAHPVRQLAKRSADICVATLVIVAFLPLYISVAAMIYVRSPGNPFFLHRRVGRHGRTFYCIKFRTMVVDAEQVLDGVLQNCPVKRKEWEETQKLSNDPRIVPGIGALLRKASLDELPQFFNILMGDMSIIGPRPVTETELSKYGSDAKYYLSVKPGLTGPWQIGGRSNTTYRERVDLDVDYAVNATLRTDLSIFVRTVRAFITGKLNGAV